MRRLARPVENERGATLVMVALSTVVLIGFLGLAIDVGALYSSRAEAQRSADAAALAGVSALIDYDPVANGNEATQEAWDRALDFAGRNAVRHQAISTTRVNSDLATGTLVAENVTVEVLRAQQRVRVTVNSPPLTNFFAGILGLRTSTVAAAATAKVEESSSSSCVFPMFIPDAPDMNNFADYERTRTGYGSTNRDAAPATQTFDPKNNTRNGSGSIAASSTYAKDFGRRVVFWPGAGGGGDTWTSYDAPAALYDFFSVDKFDPNNSKIADALNGASGCAYSVKVGDDIWTVPAARSNARKEIEERYNMDQTGTQWDPSARTVSTSADVYRTSPRVVTVALVSPKATVDRVAQSQVKVVGMMTMLLEPPPSNPTEPMIGRILTTVGTADNCSSAGNCSATVKTIRLVQ